MKRQLPKSRLQYKTAFIPASPVISFSIILKWNEIIIIKETVLQIGNYARAHVKLIPLFIIALLYFMFINSVIRHTRYPEGVNIYRTPAVLMGNRKLQWVGDGER